MKTLILTGILVFAAGPAGLFAQAPAPKVKSNGERKAIVAITTAVQAGDADGVIKAAENLLNNYADSDYKEYALTSEAKAYQAKGDMDNAQVYADRVLQINPKAYLMELLVADAITPHIKEFDLNKDEEVSKATKLYTDAIESVKVAVKPNPQLSDADWETNKKFAIGQAYNGLGMLATFQKKNDDAVKNFQLALENDPDQDAYATRLANAYLTAGKKAEALDICNKLLAKPNLHPQIRSVVTSIKSSASN
jgi:tetratricopeptide (TPR) repeat protein